jgi:hypothetical protein
MKQENLTSKIEKAFEDTGVNVEGVPEGIKFSLPFERFELPDYLEGKRYSFPGGSVAVTYNLDTGAVGYPFIEGRYKHPLLAEQDAENQKIALECFDLKPRDDLKTTIEWLLTTAVQHLQGCYGEHGEYPGIWHRLEEDMFKDYLQQ